MSHDSAGEVSGVGQVVGKLGEQMFIPWLRGQSHQREIPGDVEVVLGHPGDEGQGMPGSRCHDRGRRGGQSQGAIHGEGDLLGASFFDNGDDGILAF